MKLLNVAIGLLCCGEDLTDTHYDHPLIGDYEGYRELHLNDDWIFVYELDERFNKLFAYQTGTHDEVFGKKRRKRRKAR